VLGGSLIIACAAILSAILAFVVIWHSGRKGAGQAFAGLVLATVLLAYPAYLAQQTLWLPRLPDISTDLTDPPNFSLSREALAARAGTTPPSIVIARRKAQLKAYRRSNRFSSISMHRSLRCRGESGDGNRLEDRRTEAAGRPLRPWPYRRDRYQFYPRFPSDITLRLRPLAGQTRIDIRSASRFAPLDFGANPRHIANFEAALTAIVDKK